jgi:AI-2 transport protein TqsA
VTGDGQGARAVPWLLTAAAVIVVIAGLRAAAPLILPFLIAAFLAIVSLPLMGALERRRVPKVVAVLCTVLAGIAALMLLVVLVGRSVNQFTGAAPRYQARLRRLAASGLDWLTERGIEVPGTAFPELINPGAVLDVVGTGLTAAMAVLSNTFVVFLTMVFILLEATGLPQKLREAFGHDGADLKWLAGITREVQRYLVIKTLISLATGALAGGWLAVLGIDFALLWGLSTFALNYVPTLGSILAAIPPVLLALVQLGPWHAVAVAAGYLVINMALGNILEPYLMGRRLGLSTLVVFLSLIFWGWVWGPVGMLLSVPLTMAVKITLENTRDFRWVAVLLGAGSPAGR